MHRRHEVPDGARLADNRRELCAGRGQHAHVVVAERARLGGLHDEHALKHAPIDDRHAKERAIRILAGLAEVLEARVLRGVLHDDRAHLLRHQTGKPLGDSHLDAADALLSQPDGGGQHQRRTVWLEQVDRADVGSEPLLNEVDDVRERLGGVAAARNELADLFERPEERCVRVHRGVQG